MQSRKMGGWTSDWCPWVQESTAQRAMLGGSASALWMRALGKLGAISFPEIQKKVTKISVFPTLQSCLLRVINQIGEMVQWVKGPVVVNVWAQQVQGQK